MKSVTGSCGERIHPDVTEAILALDLLYIVVLDSYVQHRGLVDKAEVLRCKARYYRRYLNTDELAEASSVAALDP